MRGIEKPKWLLLLRKQHSRSLFEWRTPRDRAHLPECRPQARQVQSPEPSLDDAPIDRDNWNYDGAVPIRVTVRILANGSLVEADRLSSVFAATEHFFSTP